MTAALITWSLLMTCAAALACVVGARLYREVISAKDETRSAVSEAVAAEASRWAALLERERELTERTATRLVETATFGGKPQPAETAQRTENVEDRLHREISEETMRKGMDQLRDAYRAVGLSVDDEQLREEVILIASGHVPVP